MKYIPFSVDSFLKLRESGWLGESEGGPLSLFGDGEMAVLTFLGGNLCGLLVQNMDGSEVFVDQFVTLEMACDFGRAFMVK